MNPTKLENFYERLYDMCDEADACDDRFEAQVIMARIENALQGVTDEVCYKDRTAAISAVTARRFGF
jgi:hypothetical protein